MEQQLVLKNFRKKSGQVNKDRTNMLVEKLTGPDSGLKWWPAANTDAMKDLFNVFEAMIVDMKQGTKSLVNKKPATLFTYLFPRVTSFEPCFV